MHIIDDHLSKNDLVNILWSANSHPYSIFARLMPIDFKHMLRSKSDLIPVMRCFFSSLIKAVYLNVRVVDKIGYSFNQLVFGQLFFFFFEMLFLLLLSVCRLAEIKWNWTLKPVATLIGVRWVSAEASRLWTVLAPSCNIPEGISRLCATCQRGGNTVSPLSIPALWRLHIWPLKTQLPKCIIPDFLNTGLHVLSKTVQSYSSLF